MKVGELLELRPLVVRGLDGDARRRSTPRSGPYCCLLGLTRLLSTLCPPMAKPGHRAVVVLFTRDLRVHDHPALAAAAERAEHVLPLFVLDDEHPRRLRGAEPRSRSCVTRCRSRRVACASAAGLSCSGGATSSRRPCGSRGQPGPRRSSWRGRERATRRSASSGCGGRSRARGSSSRCFPASPCPAGRPRPGRRRPLPRLHALLAALAGGAAARRPCRRRSGSSSPTASSSALPARARRGEALAPELPRGRRDRRASRARGLARRRARALRRSSPTTSPRTRPRGSRPISTSAASRPARWSRGRSSATARSRSCASSAGATSTTSCSRRSPRSRTEDLRPRAARLARRRGGLRRLAGGPHRLPLVDAGMRQLLREGFMHNRARLVAGSFLTKHLGIDWRRGADRFFAHLVDGDVANNTANWQWVAGTGTDSRPNRRAEPGAAGGALRPATGSTCAGMSPSSGRPTTLSRVLGGGDEGLGDERARARVGRLRVAPARARRRNRSSRLPRRERARSASPTGRRSTASPAAVSARAGAAAAAS